MPKISVIIPSYNEEKYLNYPLNALHKQTFKDFEIIVVDGNSSDKTRDIAKKHGARIIIEKRKGIGLARNT
ncbi:MAG: glycosyltransferase family 2 protein, partial [Candidatus Marsarchaeota archaeon]|nr:glycosyltransferase family 2 protein [Candidatus Marsarchaeota archaeon]